MNIEFEVAYEVHEATNKDNGAIVFLGEQRTSKAVFTSAGEIHEQAIAMVDEALRRALPRQRLRIAVMVYD